VQAAIAADIAAAEEAQVEGELISPAAVQFIVQIAGKPDVLKQMRSVADLYAGAGEEGEEAAAGEPNSADPNAPVASQLPPELAASPVTLADMPYIMDRLSVRPPQQANAPIEGLINVNTAPLRVLMTIPGMTADAAAAIVAGRSEVDPEALRTPAWPLVAGLVDAATFRQIAPYLTTKAYQFHVEVIGYADHRKVMRRLEWVIEMIGPLAQIKYHRDLTRLGPAWPIDDEQVLVNTE